MAPSFNFFSFTACKAFVSFVKISVTFVVK